MKFKIIFLFFFLVEIVRGIYDPALTTTKPPQRRESLPWYLSGEDSVPPAEFLLPLRAKPSEAQTQRNVPGTKGSSNWRKNSRSDIEQHYEKDTQHIPYNYYNNYNDNLGFYDQVQSVTNDDHQSYDNFGSYNLNGNLYNQNLPSSKSRDVKGTLKDFNKIKFTEQSIYEGITDDYNKPRKEAIVGWKEELSKVAKYDRATGVECPYPEATGQFIYPIDCNFFVNCWKGRAFIQPCAPGTRFNPETLECDFPYKVKCYGGELADFVGSDYSQPEISGQREPLSIKYSPLVTAESYQPTCLEQLTGFLPHPEDCKKYLQCVNGRGIIRDCGPGTVFNPIIGVCDWPKNVRGCENTIEEPEDTLPLYLTPPRSAPILSPTRDSSLSYVLPNSQNSWRPIPARQQVTQPIACPRDFSGISKHPTDCAKFLQCDHGATFVMDCGPGTVFNPSISVCDWPYNVPGCGQAGQNNNDNIPVEREGRTHDLNSWNHQGNSNSGFNSNHPSYSQSQSRPCSYPGCSNVGQGQGQGLGYSSGQGQGQGQGRFPPRYPNRQNRPPIVDNRPSRPNSYNPQQNSQQNYPHYNNNHNIRNNNDNLREFPTFPGNIYVEAPRTNNQWKPITSNNNQWNQPTWRPSPADSTQNPAVFNGHGYGHGYDPSGGFIPGKWSDHDQSLLPHSINQESPISFTDKPSYRLSDPGNSKTQLNPGMKGKDIYNQVKGQSADSSNLSKSTPMGIYVNANGTRIYGHYILKNDNKSSSVSPDKSKIKKVNPSGYVDSNYYNITNINGSKWKPLNNSYSDTHPDLTSQLNPQKHYQPWKSINRYNKTQYTINNHFNQSHIGWEPENKTNNHLYNHNTRTYTTSEEPIRRYEANNVGNYNAHNGNPISSTDSTPDAFGSSYSPSEIPTNRGEKILPDGVMVPWEKPDTNAPEVSIDEDINYGYDDVLGNENKISPVSVGPNIDKYDVDVLDVDTWKPKITNKTKGKSNNDDNSSIMKIDSKIVDLEIFNVESAPWQLIETAFPVYYVPPLISLGHTNDKLITPLSGQVLRLRGGSSNINGYVEVQGIEPGWGVVCDTKHGWTLKEANLVCRQLGFTRGAETAWQGRVKKDESIPDWIAATSVQCFGNETNFQSCKFTHGSECNIQRDAVAVSCLPNRVAHCRGDETPHDGNCYHLADSSSGLNHAEALKYCSSKNSRLVDITTQGENNFLSEWLIQSHPEIESIMTSGIGFTTFNRTIWLWEDSAKAKFKFSKWWPGWRSDKKIPPWAGSRPVCIIMKKKYPCYNNPDSICLSDYFFWDIEDCAASMKGHAYICKRPYDDISCVYGKGHQYLGKASVAASGKPCLPWNHTTVAYPLLVNVVDRAVREKLKTHNYCRNPNPFEESKPWCFTDISGERESCDIPSCGYTGSVRSPIGGTCKTGHFECLPEECIPLHWVCDGESDCTNGRDELRCSEHLEFFTKIQGHRLTGYEVEKWLNTPAKTCALRCKEAKFTCRSFSHKISENLCLLSDNNVGSTGALEAVSGFDYYEMIDLSVDCTGMFVCNNKKCINQTQVCDGKNDCKDRSDENSCDPAKLDYGIRLSGSENEYEGRIEVKIMGVWGQVCDDNFGMLDAEVICRELGFELGALELHLGGFFGNMDPPTRFMVDQLTCRGNETSLRECDFDGWGVHNCSPEETAGVVCKTAVETCPEGNWKCDTSPVCIPTPFICDEVVDCPDSSDESPAHCDAPFEIRLANGSSPSEGRVEIRHHGVWGTVCDDDFTHAAAKVICRSLGFGGSSTAKKESFFGPGEGPIWLDEIFCYGNETQIYRCEHSSWGQSNCNHEEDVGVICQDVSVNIEEDESNRVVTEVNINDILPSNCGKRAEDFHNEEEIFAKVVRGSVAPKDSYPWQASIRVRGHSRSNHWCGAVVISPLHVLTAAHCLEGYNKGTYFIRAGDYNTEIIEGTEADANIEDYYIHEEFRKGHRMNNDIALVLLKGRGIPLGEHIMPICLPPRNVEYPYGLNCTISGFGSIETGKSAHSRDLRFGWIPLIDQNICRADYVYGEGAISDGMMCAGYLNEGVDACDGDSGGPLACHHNGVFTLYGITSWGQHCGKANKPGVYVRIAHYRDWIDKKIRDSLSGR
ncbi:uncharacterized protein LOC141531154 isoform X2 [Cotesia typhae]|uniref:uncharacterized protein LOC141531154 isoform X2 n=1 Tax=Cotesia typhae TaxID=2053667 RepID=UPI003D680502